MERYGWIWKVFAKQDGAKRYESEAKLEVFCLFVAELTFINLNLASIFRQNNVEFSDLKTNLLIFRKSKFTFKFYAYNKQEFGRKFAFRENMLCNSFDPTLLQQRSVGDWNFFFLWNFAFVPLQMCV